MSQIAALRARAAELKIPFDQRWGENKLIGVITAEEEARGIPLSFSSEPVATEKPEPVAEPEKVVEQVQEQPEQLEVSDTGATNETKQDDKEDADIRRENLPEAEETKPVSEIDGESIAVKNISPNPVTIGFMYKAKPGFTVTLTGNRLTDKLRKKIAYGVKLGLLELV